MLLRTPSFARALRISFCVNFSSRGASFPPAARPPRSTTPGSPALINDPVLLTNGGMSQALAGTTQFMVAIGATSATQPATIGMINALAANAGVAVGPGAQALVGEPIWQVLQAFATSTLVSNAMAAPIANFQNLLLAGGPAPTGSLLTLPGTPGSSLTLTTGVDTPTTGFSGGHGARRCLRALSSMPGPHPTPRWAYPTRSISVTIWRPRAAPSAQPR